MALPIKFIAAALGINARDFAMGWAEGITRFKAPGSPGIVAGSHFPQGSVAFGASQAAVAYYIGVGK